jgi:hypothetical protein
MPIALVGLAKSQFYGLIFENHDAAVVDPYSQKEKVVSLEFSSSQTKKARHLLRRYSTRKVQECVPFLQEFIGTTPGDVAHLKKILSKYDEKTIIFCARMYNRLSDSLKK